MKIQMMPRYGTHAASSRLRVYRLAAALNQFGLADAVVGRTDAADVLFMQKLDLDSIIYGHRAALYDFDDVWPSDVLNHAARAVHAFTVDTPGHGAIAPGRWELLPDMIDYNPTAPLPAAKPNTLAWFGNWPNYESVSRLMVAAGGFCNPVTIADGSVGLNHVAWNFDTFPDDLRTCGTALLSHSGADQGKSVNKMIAAVTLGVPCIVHESAAYEELAKAVELDWCIVRDSAELAEAWKRLQKPAERKKYLAAIQPHVWEQFRPEAVAKRFIEICEAIL